MSKEHILEMFFVRHGQTMYTEIYPDLTEEGEIIAAQTGHEIKNRIDTNLPFSIFSSPYARARSTADIIGKILGYNKEVFSEPDITRIQFYNKEAQPLFDQKVKELTDEFRGKQLPYKLDRYSSYSLCYSLNELFDNPVYFEPRSEVRKRFYRFLAGKIEKAVKGLNKDRYIIAVSHYEVIYHLPEKLFCLNYEIDMPYDTGEMFTIKVSGHGAADLVLLQVEFRNRIKENLIFDYKQKIFT